MPAKLTCNFQHRAVVRDLAIKRAHCVEPPKRLTGRLPDVRTLRCLGLNQKCAIQNLLGPGPWLRRLA
jgi:hypothetical protein